MVHNIVMAGMVITSLIETQYQTDGPSPSPDLIISSIATTAMNPPPTIRDRFNAPAPAPRRCAGMWSINRAFAGPCETWMNSWIRAITIRREMNELAILRNGVTAIRPRLTMAM
jgi:hypothetical protein